MSDESLDNLFGMLEKDIRLPLFIYDDAKKYYKREHNLKSEIDYWEKLMNADLKNERIVLNKIGSKYLTIRTYDNYMQLVCPYVTPKKLQIKKCFLYDNDLNSNWVIRKIKINKPYKINKIEKVNNDYYAVIDVNKKEEESQMVYLNKLKYELIDCCACLNKSILIYETPYFKCSHNEICLDCYKQLNNKICPICRSP